MAKRARRFSIKDEQSSQNMTKTVLELDLASYSDIARVLEENLNIEAVKLFEDQIQAFVDHGLNTLGLRRDAIVLGTAGDNAILVFDDAATMHQFAQAVQQETLVYNRSKSVELAKRWFRMGAATGTVLVLAVERRIVGSTISRAVRLEAAAHKGQLVVDLPTFEALPEELREHYGIEEVLGGKREEQFKVRRYTVIDVPDDSSALVTKGIEALPGGIAVFSGKWAGQWGNTLDHVLVVEKIEGRNVTFIYSWGVAPEWNINRPGFVRATGTVDDGGVLRGTLLNGGEVAYKLSPDQQTLAGEYVLRGNTTFGSFKRQ